MAQTAQTSTSVFTALLTAKEGRGQTQAVRRRPLHAMVSRVATALTAIQLRHANSYVCQGFVTASA